MATLLWILISTFLVSLVSFIGIFTISLKEKILEKALFFLVSLSIGGLMGGAFLHLLPEAIEKFGNGDIFLYTLTGFFLFLIIEKIIHWRHCHESHCPIHAFAYMNLIGDGIHNFIDGLIMAAGFIASPGLGIASTIAIFLHEIPQEIGDFGVLVYGGFSRKKALIFNFLTALTAILGGVIGFYLLSFTEIASKFLLAFAAGGFLYIAASDLIPEIRKEMRIKKFFINFGIIFLGILIMYSLKFLGIE
ncbi:ZIP family metal transporter [Patescibacteria group bacterium]|nr:ZIP family metal transporter [Patescibacteria group bacterium]MBU4367295.1 ZIP family metal transporter [Patescibacteria group bacterium]MBU4461632.1 ZIP family metal transporter [Patescibacteria group bacterium]MCG2699682.1 ZIP family metal transporter [Candidatus Parcubacteria bacterium]